MSRSIHFLLFLFLFYSVFPGLVFPQEFLSGQVLSVNKIKMELVIDSKETRGNKTKTERKILIRIAKKNALPRHDGKPVFPAYIKPGSRIRVWGYWKKDKNDVLFAHSIKGCAGGGCSDPTGIMSRLKKLLDSAGKTSVNKGGGAMDSFGSGGDGPGGNGGGPGGNGGGPGGGPGGGGGGNGGGGGGNGGK